jgi:hypothetical protein
MSPQAVFFKYVFHIHSNSNDRLCTDCLRRVLLTDLTAVVPSISDSVNLQFFSVKVIFYQTFDTLHKRRHLAIREDLTSTPIFSVAFLFLHSSVRKLLIVQHRARLPSQERKENDSL